MGVQQSTSSVTVSEERPSKTTSRDVTRLPHSLRKDRRFFRDTVLHDSRSYHMFTLRLTIYNRNFSGIKDLWILL